MTQSDLMVIYSLLSDHAIPDDFISVRLSSRAKQLIFKSSLNKGIEIVVPHDADIGWIMDGIENKISWVKSLQIKIAQGRKQLSPEKINLKALRETWTINYTELSDLK
ncbi:uncharacterized protein METZ01_LOCUS479587, partial [marine metagenome]